MDLDQSKQTQSKSQPPNVAVSGAEAFKPSTTQELDQSRQIKEQEDAERQRLTELKQQQRARKRLIADCQEVMNVNYDWLLLDDYPDNRTVAIAKRSRDYWLFLCCAEFIVFCAGVLELVPAWVGGSAFGLFFITYCFSFKSFRRFFTSEPTLGELLQKRKMLEFRALNHIKLLEGQDGLAWRCRRLAKYNGNLNRTLFQGVMDVSAQKRLFGVIKEKKHIRLYLQLMLEAEKAYKRVQKEYMKHHFNNLERGVDDTAESTDESSAPSGDTSVPQTVTMPQ